MNKFDIPVLLDPEESCLLSPGIGNLFVTRKSDLQFNVNGEWVTISKLKKEWGIRFISDGINARVLNTGKRRTTVYTFKDFSDGSTSL